MPDKPLIPAPLPTPPKDAPQPKPGSDGAEKQDGCK